VVGSFKTSTLMINAGNMKHIKPKSTRFFMELQAPLGQGLLITEVSRSHSDTSQSVGLLWTGDKPDAVTSTWQHTPLTTDKHPCPRWDSSPQPQKASGRSPTS
jgi:hypothetical protein